MSRSQNFTCLSLGSLDIECLASCQSTRLEDNLEFYKPKLSKTKAKTSKNKDDEFLLWFANEAQTRIEDANELGDEDVESRIDSWLNARGIYPDEPTSKQAEYFSAKKSRISSFSLMDLDFSGRCSLSRRIHSSGGPTAPKQDQNMLAWPMLQAKLDPESPISAHEVGVEPVGLRGGSEKCVLLDRERPVGGLWARRNARLQSTLQTKIEDQDVFAEEIELDHLSKETQKISMTSFSEL